MHKYLNRLLYTALLGGTLMTTAGHAYADPERRAEERHEEHREERHEERRAEERHEERREVRAEDRHWSHAAPPALRYERHEPRRGYAWIGGRWDWRDGRYSWVAGRYEPERRGFIWREPRYELRDGVYVNIDGGWIAAGPRAAPPVLREERWEARPGQVWVRGHWDWNGADWAWVGGHYEGERAGFLWREPRWEMRDGVYVKVDGAWVAR
jgi:hypothetical protein